MEIADSARRHSVSDEDMLHAFNHALRSIDQDDRRLYIGPSRTGAPLEVVVIGDNEDDPAIIHAMPLRPKFHRHL